jgi:hypothetical protein
VGVFYIRNRGTRHVIAAKDPLNLTIRNILLVVFSHNFIFVVILIFYIIIITTTIILIFLFLCLPVYYLLT